MDGSVRLDECGLGGCVLFGSDVKLSRPYASVGWLWTKEGERTQSRLVCHYLGEVFPVGDPWDDGCSLRDRGVLGDV